MCRDDVTFSYAKISLDSSLSDAFRLRLVTKTYGRDPLLRPDPSQVLTA